MWWRQFISVFAVVIISTLERYAIQQSLPSNCVPSIFSEAKIPSSPEIAEAYNVILCRKDPFWMRESVRSRLMEVIYIFVAEFIDNANRLPLRQRQAIFIFILLIIST